MNKLNFGDNLDMLREKIKDESVDLVYLDPPFKSNANYNVLFKPGRVVSEAQAEAFRPLPIGKPRIVMNGDHLEIQASVDLDGLEQLQTMLQKYTEILEMMAPKKDGAAN